MVEWVQFEDLQTVWTERVKDGLLHLCTNSFERTTLCADDRVEAVNHRSKLAYKAIVQIDIVAN